MKSTTLNPIALAALLCFAASAQAQKAEVIHWWTSGGEAAAIKEYAKTVRKGVILGTQRFVLIQGYR